MFELPAVRKEDTTLATEKDKMSGTTEHSFASEPALSSIDQLDKKRLYNLHYMEVVWISKK